MRRTLQGIVLEITICKNIANNILYFLFTCMLEYLFFSFTIYGNARCYNYLPPLVIRLILRGQFVMQSKKGFPLLW